MSDQTKASLPLSPREVFELQQAAILNLDTDAQAELFAEDGVMEFPLAPTGLPHRLEGREQIRQIIGAAAQPLVQLGLRFERYDALRIHETTDPEVLIVEFEMTGSMKGKNFECPIFKFFGSARERSS